MIKKYRKKPASFIEAIQFDDKDSGIAIIHWITDFSNGKWGSRMREPQGLGCVFTLEITPNIGEDMIACLGDWVIKIDDHIGVCKNFAFQATYEEVKDE